MTLKKNYEEGSWFIVPLEQNRWALGLVARTTTKGGTILAYFFVLDSDKIPDLDDLAKLEPSDAVHIWRVGDLGLIEGTWKIIGKLNNWDRSKWIIPKFVRHEDFSNRTWLVGYSDDDPSVVEFEERVVNNVVGYERNGLYGYKAAEVALSKIQHVK